MERPVEKVADDLRNGLISPEKAQSDYAVVADPTTLVVNNAGTRELRERRSGA